MELATLKLKVFFEKLWTFLKLYWKELVFLALFVYLLVFVKRKTDLVNDLLAEREATRIAYQQNIDRLNQVIQTETATRRKIESDYQALIERINKEHADEVKRIAEVRAEEIKELIKKHQNNPVLMAQTINDLFGIPIMAIPNERQTWEPQQ